MSVQVVQVVQGVQGVLDVEGRVPLVAVVVVMVVVTIVPGIVLETVLRSVLDVPRVTDVEGVIIAPVIVEVGVLVIV